MSQKNMKIWDKLRTPPKEALKTIGGGRLKGMTDISPQWRYQAITELFGPCGQGWHYEITKLWVEPGAKDEMMAFATIDFYYWIELENSQSRWSKAIPGIGGSMIVTKEKSGLHNSDEAFKMAVTDALSVALKMIGVASDIYMGGKVVGGTGSKYEGKKNPKCPECKKNEAVFVDKDKEFSYYCWKKKGGCGHKWTVTQGTETKDDDNFVKFQKAVDALESKADLQDWVDKYWAYTEQSLGKLELEKAERYIKQLREVLA